MAEVVQFPNRAEVHEKAAAWLARVDKGLSDEEERELGEWLGSSGAHRDAFLELAALWDEADRLSELAELFPLERAAGRRAKARFRGPWLYATAAALGLAVVAALLASRLGWPPPERPAAAATFASAYRTPVGARSTERLPDDSVVRLNTDTALEVEYATDARRVHLRRGEAYFDVAHDASRPFGVHVGDRVVEALGTAFNVRLDGDGGIQVTVTSGRIRVTETAAAAPQRPSVRGPPRELAPTLVEQGEIAVLAPGTAAARVDPEVRRLDPADLDVRLAWQRGVLIFRGETLKAMLEEFARYTTTEFVLADASLADVRVGGYFEAGDVSGLLAALDRNFRIKAERTADNRILLSSGSNAR